MLIATHQDEQELRLVDASAGSASGTLFFLFFLPLLTLAGYQFHGLVDSANFAELVWGQVIFTIVLVVPIAGMSRAFGGDPGASGWMGKIIRWLAPRMPGVRKISLRRTDGGAEVLVDGRAIPLNAPLEVRITTVIEEYKDSEGKTRTRTAHPIAIAELEGEGTFDVGAEVMHGWVRSVARRIATQLGCALDDAHAGRRIEAGRVGVKLCDTAPPAPGPMPESIEGKVRFGSAKGRMRLALIKPGGTLAALGCMGLFSIVMWLFPAFMYFTDEGRGELMLLGWSTLCAFFALLSLLGVVTVGEAVDVGERTTVVGPPGLHAVNEHVFGMCAPNADIVEVLFEPASTGDGGTLTVCAEQYGVPVSVPFAVDDEARDWIVGALEHAIAAR